MKKIKLIITSLTVLVFSELVLILFGLGLLITFPTLLLYACLVGVGLFLGIYFSKLPEDRLIKLPWEMREKAPFYEEGNFRDIF